MFEMDKQKFGEFICELRKQQGMTQKELAQRLFLSDKAVSKWERGISMPDISLLVPLSEILGVSVSELLECHRMEQTNSMDTKEVETLVKKAINFSKEDLQKNKVRKRKNIALLGVCLFFACIEIAVLLKLAFPADQVMISLLTAELLSFIFGCYFCLFVKETLPSYYDDNKINFYSDGVFRMNLPGISLNNSNWPRIVQTVRLWSMLGLVGYPLLYFLVSLFLKEALNICAPFIILAATLGGLFIPIYVVGKKYE